MRVAHGCGMLAERGNFIDKTTEMSPAENIAVVNPPVVNLPIGGRDIVDNIIYRAPHDAGDKGIVYDKKMGVLMVVRQLADCCLFYKNSFHESGGFPVIYWCGLD